MRIARLRPRAMLTFHAGIETLEFRRLLSAAAWSVGPALPSARAQEAVIADGSGTLYTFGGGTSTVQTLASGSTAWGTSSPLDSGSLAPGAGISSAGFVVFGGKSGEVLNTASHYDPIGENTVDVAAMNSTRWEMAYASDASGSVYAIGGQDINGAVLSSVEAFNGTTWTLRAALPAARMGAAAVADGAGHIFVFGGAPTTASDSVSDTTYEYTIASDTWTSLAAMPTAVRNEAAVFGSNGLIYILGGISTTGTTAAVQVYDPTANTWASDTPLPAPVSSEGAANDGLGRINVVGGLNSSGTPTTNVWHSQRLNQPEAAPVFTSIPVTQASADKLYTYQAVASANPQAAYSLITAPSGMTIDPNTGAVTWQPAAAQAGTQNVDIRAANRDGPVDQVFSIKTVLESVPPTAPTNVHVVSETTSSVTFGLTASIDQYGIAGYRVYWTYGHSGRGGGYTTKLILDHPGAATTFTVPGLATGQSYSLSVSAYNSSGYESGRTPIGVTVYRAPTVSVYSGTFSAVAKHAFSFTAFGSGYPAVTYSLLNAPAGLTINSATGAATWTPTPKQTGVYTPTVVATNAVGTAQVAIKITVTPDVPVLFYEFMPTTGPNYALVGVPASIQIFDNSLTTSSYSLVSAPKGVSLNSTTGLIKWTPTEAEAGTLPITVRGTNLYGHTDLTINVTTYITPPVSNITVTNTTLLNPTISWTAPAGSNDANIAGYTIGLQGYNGFSYVPFSFDTKSPKTNFVLTGLIKGLYYYTTTVTPYDAAGHVGVSATGSAFNYAPNLPVMGYSGTPAQTIVGQPLSLTITNTNASLPVTYAVVSGPSGLTVNATTGAVTWTPTSAQDGTQVAKFSATNSVGTVTETINLGVFPTSAPTSLAFSNKTSTGFNISWQPPSVNATQVAGYHIVVYVGNTHTSYAVSATTLSYAVPANAPGYVYVIWISAYDSNGFDGLVGILDVPF